MKSCLDASVCQNLRTALSRVWLETNGLGGYACSTIVGANTRRQHGLLVVPAQPPLHRHVLLSKVEERVLVNGHESWLSTNLYPGTVFPHGFNIQTEFRRCPWPVFRYSTAEFEVEKSVCLIHGANTLVIAYRNLRSLEPLDLRVRPLFAYRDHSIVRQRNENVSLAVERDGDIVAVQPRETLPRLYFHAHCRAVEAQADWYYRFTYPTEQDRGAEFEEDLFTTHEMAFTVPVGKTVYVVVSTARQPGVDGAALLAGERQRREKLCADADGDRANLTAAAAAFAARRGAGLTLLDGFPWHTDSGRWAMVALPGLLLHTGQHDAAEQVLRTLTGLAKEGLLPHRFDELSGEQDHHAVDASLWFVVALWRFWRTTQRTAAVADLLAVAREVVTRYRAGTLHDIHVDKDGLLIAGGSGSHLTWMDVKIEGYVPIPRHGKPVEVNALWLNALLLLAQLEEHVARDPHAAVALRKQGDHVRDSFIKTFWNPTAGCLFDVVRPDEHDASVRPNQLLAVSLPFTPLAADQQRAVFDVVTRELLTPYGLRTLARHSEKYAPKVAGTMRQRDFARHQGTVWSWWIGPYADAYLRVHGTGKASRKELRNLLQPLLDYLADNGSVAEMFDGDPPHRPAGCLAFGPAVGELRRAYDACAGG